eukprot:SAG25_NODE_7979_length_447_cov_1.186782_1_plen_41_part_01
MARPTWTMMDSNGPFVTQLVRAFLFGCMCVACVVCVVCGFG